MDAWLRVLGELSAWAPARRLHARLSQVVRDRLAPGLRKLRAWDAGAGAREALRRPIGLDYGGFLPVWETDEAPRPDPALFRGATAGERMENAAPRLLDAFAGFADALQGVARAAAELDAAPDGRQKPQMAL